MEDASTINGGWDGEGEVEVEGLRVGSIQWDPYGVRLVEYCVSPLSSSFSLSITPYSVEYVVFALTAFGVAEYFTPVGPPSKPNLIFHPLQIRYHCQA